MRVCGGNSLSQPNGAGALAEGGCPPGIGTTSGSAGRLPADRWRDPRRALLSRAATDATGSTASRRASIDARGDVATLDLGRSSQTGRPAACERHRHALRRHAASPTADRSAPGPAADRYPPRTVDRRQDGTTAVERAARDLVPVEGVEMAEVEDQAMAIGDRSFVERRVGDESEQRVGVLARLLQLRRAGRSCIAASLAPHMRPLGASPGITRFRARGSARGPWLRNPVHCLYAPGAARSVGHHGPRSRREACADGLGPDESVTSEIDEATEEQLSLLSERCDTTPGHVSTCCCGSLDRETLARVMPGRHRGRIGHLGAGSGEDAAAACRLRERRPEVVTRASSALHFVQP